MHHDRKQLDVRDRRWFLRNFRRCFVGSVRQGNRRCILVLWKELQTKTQFKHKRRYVLAKEIISACIDALIMEHHHQEAVDLMLQLKWARTRWEAVLLGRHLVTVKWQCFVQYAVSI